MHKFNQVARSCLFGSTPPLLLLLALVAALGCGQASSATQLPPHFVQLSNITSSSFRNNKHPLINSHNNGHAKSDSQQNNDGLLHRSLLEKSCIGTSNRLSVQHNKTEHYQNLADRYRNCTYISGNLEITWLENNHNGKPLDLTFLESIREITGYLLIAYVEVDKIRMPNLQIIRGRDLFRFNNGKKEEFAMLLIENQIKTLELPNLREIIVGSVGAYRNTNLCYLNTIHWDEILNVDYAFIQVANSTLPDCPSCDFSCQNSCWGPGPDMCQKFSKKNCAKQCDKGRCYSDGPRECCHLFCAGGCYGPSNTDCFACKNFNNDGECTQECPSKQEYNPTKFSWEPNPNGSYAFGSVCVKECPDHMLIDGSACVRTCPPNKRNLNGECVACGGPCPKNCQGVDVVHSGNIDQLTNCTVIEGSITILDTSFAGFTEVFNNNSFGPTHAPMNPSKLESLKELREITGFLNIQASHRDFKNLSFLRNLRQIGGRQTTEMFSALSIIKTSLVSLNLRSLNRVRSGKILIEENSDLCFVEKIDWQKLNITKSSEIIARKNADSHKCQMRGLRCHNQCSRDGCWGPGQDECLSCNNYKLEEYCVDNCTSTQALGFLSYDAGERTCKRCHSECRDGCTGTESKHCFKCKGVKDGPYCVSECPGHKYNNDGICEECDKSCVSGCTGPSNKLGEGGCNSCAKAIINSTDPTLVARCIRLEEPCPDAHYQEYTGPQTDGLLKALSNKPVCRKCHQKCKSCTGMGTHVSVCDCAKYRAGEQCEDSCPREYFADDQARQCNKCSPECNGCFGPTEADCINCRVYRIYHNSYTPTVAAQVASARIATGQLSPESKLNQQQMRFNCTAQCPTDKPYRINEKDIGSRSNDPYCSDVPDPDMDSQKTSTLGSVPMVIIILAISLAIIICVFLHRFQTENQKRWKLTYQLSGIDDQETIIPSNEKANLRQIRSIKETELRRGKILGSGVGGTVYQGQWYSEDGVKPRPVAIKVLHDNGSSNVNKEFLDEAYIMASVEHKNLVCLLAICMTPSQLMLITPLMPFGCLLEHVRTHTDIGSKMLLEWCKQIANGMAYLEEKRMVHRDLALRNVLLLKPGRAMISDFGLAKLLELDQMEYHSGAKVKLPIKWLAPESFREKKFTHKSDVWAFGVTIWELLTFGMKPFEDCEPKDVPMAIEKGARLRQPSYVSAEVYKVMYSCWFYNPEDRPNFQSLAKSFADFAKDPQRYLACGTKGVDNELQREFGRGSESDDNGFEESNSEVNSFSEEESTGSRAGAITDTNVHANGRINELLGLEQRHQHSHNSSQNGQVPSTPTFNAMSNFPSNFQLMDEDVFTCPLPRQHPVKHPGAIDLNNNGNLFGATDRLNMNTDSCSSMHHTMSTVSIGQKSGQKVFETDPDDYLLPSPCSNEDKFKFLTTHGGTSSRFPPARPFARDPPHSAGLIGISNEEYFMSGLNYVSNVANNASSGHIPSSLV